MLAKKAVSTGKSVTRDKEAKIGSIIDATRTLIETMGYEKVTIRDIAESAGVSVGLIYKYFPGGKFDILVKGFGNRYIDDLLMIRQPENIDYNDFPGYMRTFIKNWQQIVKDNSSLIKALTVAALLEGQIVEEIKKVDVKDYTTISEFFNHFKGVHVDEKNSLKILMDWGITIKGILVFSLTYPETIKSEEDLTDLLVDLSLRIWGYKAPQP